MSDKLIINADDMGMTKGTNRAIIKAFDVGRVTHTSLMTNLDHTAEAITSIQARPNLSIGIHLNLTYGKPIINSSLYCDENGYFNLNYIDLVLKSITNKIFLKVIKKELEAQITVAINNNIKITHLDSHRHIHMIPSIYKIVYKLSEKYNIPRVRLIKENINYSIKISNSLNFITNGGFIKYLLLKLFTCINQKYGDKYNNRIFFSILYTGTINKKMISSIMSYGKKIEIMIHPNYTSDDANHIFYDIDEKKYRLAHDREIELEALL